MVIPMANDGGRCQICGHPLGADATFKAIKAKTFTANTHPGIGLKCPPKEEHLKRCRFCNALIGKRAGPDPCPYGGGSGSHVPVEE